MEHTVQFLKCLADPSRLAILHILAERDSYVELIAAKLDLTPGTVCYHLKKMEHAGIVRCSRTQFYVIYSLNRELFDRPLSELLFASDRTMERENAYRQKVLDSFFVNGRLTALPSQRKKREIVLEKVAESCDGAGVRGKGIESPVAGFLRRLLHLAPGTGRVRLPGAGAGALPPGAERLERKVIGVCGKRNGRSAGKSLPRPRRQRNAAILEKFSGFHQTFSEFSTLYR